MTDQGRVSPQSDTTPSPADFSAAEWAVRLDVACAYRLFHRFGWHELIYNHITARVPGTRDRFLINPFGLMYREVTASNLVEIDLDGRVVRGEHPVNPAGFVVHSAVHAARPDAHCVMHTHTTAGMAVACQEGGLLPLSFPSAFFHGRVAYHDFEGITLDLDERGRLAANLGDRPVMILRNHGLLSCGRDVAEAFANLYTLQRACEVQIAAQAGGTAALRRIPEPVMARTTTQAMGPGMDAGLVFAAMRRWMEDEDPGWRR